MTEDVKACTFLRNASLCNVSMEMFLTCFFEIDRDILSIIVVLCKKLIAKNLKTK